jgi:AcrR family transcriptional regulator
VFEARTSTTKARGQETRARIVEAAVETLKREGFGGASARAIARTGGFNQALVFYHFGSVSDLLLAALDETSARRMARYREVVDDADSLQELVAAASEVYREDLASGHIKVLAEMIAGASSMPELGPEIVRRIEPWIDFARDAVARVSATLPIPMPVSPEDAAFGIVALYLGIELLTHLEGDGARSDRLFELASRLAATAGLLFGTPPASGTGGE